MSDPTIKVRLELHAQSLKNIAGFGYGSSDPFAVVTLLPNDPKQKPQVIGSTEVIKNNLSPRWTKYIELDYSFSQNTRINVGIWDAVPNSGNKMMGSALFEVGEVLGARGNTKAKKLRRGGTLFARITKAPEIAGLLHLKLCGVKLKNAEGLFGKSDPFVEINSRVEAAAGLTWRPIYRSEPVMNNLSPEWPEFSLDIARLCEGDLDKPIQISVWDFERSGKHKPMGAVETSVNGLLAARSRDSGFSLTKKGKDLGKIVVKSADLEGYVGASVTNGNTVGGFANALSPPQHVAPATSPAQHEPVGAFSEALNRPPPTFQDSAVRPDSPVRHSTPMEPSAPSASDSAFSAALNRLPQKYQGPATAAFSKLSISGSNRPPNSTQPANSSLYSKITPLAPAIGAVSALSKPTSSRPSAPSSEYSPAISSSYNKITPIAPPAPRAKFVDYLTGGLELELNIAIDFTGSNGDPRKPGTLHYIYPDGQLNDYEKAITAVGSIIARYDADQKFSVFGFGAKYGGVIQHCFQVGPSEELVGISGVLDGYRGVFRTGLTMSGPTVFDEVIDYAAATARSKLDASKRIGQQSYKILLILTDGAVTDIEQTKRAISAASDAPLSIVIVGIGEADFSAMQFLDDFQANTGKRDIVQFVEFSKHKHDKSSLTRATLEEIPDQLVEFFTNIGMKPLPPISGSQISLFPVEADDEDIDLNIDINAEGEISLMSYNGPVYDDTRYGTYSDFALAKPTAPPAGHHAPYVPGQHQQAHAPVAQPVQPSIFHVQVPPNCGPGTQLQIQHPTTGQVMYVTIPPGVGPGGTFGVQY